MAQSCHAPSSHGQSADSPERVSPPPAPHFYSALTLAVLLLGSEVDL